MIDLHSHSTHSDGSLAPDELIDYAVERGLSAIALTDHDCMSGNSIAESRAKKRNITFLPGVELEIFSEEGTFHLLGLNTWKKNSELERQLEDIRGKRTLRNREMVKKMNGAGIPATLDEIAELAGGEIVSRLHFAHFLINRKITKTVKDAFKNYLSPGCPFFIPKESMTLDKAIPLIHDAGGKAVIAHPFSLKRNFINLCNFIRDCKKDGLDGIEAYHSEYGYTLCTRLEAFAVSNGLIVTAGSDFHGEGIKNRRLGLTAGRTKIEDRFLDGILDHVNR